MLSPNTKILVADNELANTLKQPSPLFTTSASPGHLASLKKFATIFETAESSRPVPNTKILPRPASVQLSPIHVPQTPTKIVTAYSTPVTSTTEPTASPYIPAPMTIQ